MAENEAAYGEEARSGTIIAYYKRACVHSSEFASLFHLYVLASVTRPVESCRIDGVFRRVIASDARFVAEARAMVARGEAIRYPIHTLAGHYLRARRLYQGDLHEADQ